MAGTSSEHRVPERGGWQPPGGVCGYGKGLLFIQYGVFPWLYFLAPSNLQQKLGARKKESIEELAKNLRLILSEVAALGAGWAQRKTQWGSRCRAGRRMSGVTPMGKPSPAGQAHLGGSTLRFMKQQHISEATLALRSRTSGDRACVCTAL